MSISPLRLSGLLIGAIAILVTPAFAQQAVAPQDNATPPVDILSATSLPADATPVYDNEPTHPSISLTPDRSELVRLDREAGTVIVGNPAHLSVLMDSNKSLVLVGKVPGATYFTVLDDGGAVIMQRHVIIAAPKEQYVRVRRSCAGAAKGTACQETSVFYCPDMCHNVSISAGEAANAAAGAQDTNSDTGGSAPADPEQPASEMTIEGPTVVGP